MPMGKYEDFDDCVRKNASKDDPKGYCAVVKRNIEGKELSQAEKELIATDMAPCVVAMPYGGATTFEEADKYRDSLEKSGELNGLFYMAQDLSNNALRNPEIKPEDKAGKLEQIARGLATRVSQFIKGKAAQPAPSVEPPKVEPRTSGFTITKDAKGEMRWFGFVSGNFKDRDKEIFPADVHDEYVGYVDKTKDYPELWLWHTPGTRFGVADFVDVMSGFVFMTGPIDKGKEAIAEAVAAMPDQGMSHGFKFHYREPGVIGVYRTFEASVLPLTHAAFPWTSIQILTKEIGMKPEKRQYLEQVLGKERVEQLLGQADTLQKSLVAAGIEWKEFDPNPAPPPAPAAKPEDLTAAFKETAEYKALAAIPDALVRLAKDHADVTAIFDASIKALQEENKALKDQVGQKQDDLLRGLLTRRAHTPAAPASKSKDNLLDPAKDKDLAQAEPKLPVAAGLVASIIGKM